MAHAFRFRVEIWYQEYNIYAFTLLRKSLSEVQMQFAFFGMILIDHILGIG